MFVTLLTNKWFLFGFNLFIVNFFVASEVMHSCKRLITIGASNFRPATCVRLLVAFQAPLLPVGFVTLPAIERSLYRMDAFVPIKFLGSIKRLITDIANERPVSF